MQSGPEPVGDTTSPLFALQAQGDPLCRVDPASRRTKHDNRALVVGKYETVPIGQRLQLKVMKMETNESPLEDVAIGHLMRRAYGTMHAVKLLEALSDDTLWSDSCTIAECIEDVAGALGWKHERLVRYMLEISVWIGVQKGPL